MTSFDTVSPPTPPAGEGRLQRLLGSNRWAAPALLVLLCLALYLPGLTTMPATDRDEARFAQASKQMVETGDLVDIRFQDVPRHKKPIGIYWAQAAAAKLFGPQPANPVWPYRIPSLLAAIVAVLVTYSLGARLFGRMAGFWGAALLASCLLLGVEARLAKTDAALLATTVVAMACMSRAWDPQLASLRTAIIFWVAVGIGVLIKGPVIVLIVGLSALTLSLWSLNFGWLRSLRPLLGLLIVPAIVLPWLIAILYSTGGAFLEQSVGGDLLPKLLGGQEAHGAWSGYYLALLPLTFWPGAIFVLLSLPWIWRNRRDPDIRFLLAWLVPGWLVFEMIPTKLPHYVLPFYPPLALLAAAAMVDLVRPEETSARRGWRLTAIVLTVTFGLVIAVALLAVGIHTDRTLHLAGLIGAIVAALSALALGWAVRNRHRVQAMPIALGGAVATFAVAFGIVMPTLDGFWVARKLAAALPGVASEHVSIAGYHEPSAVLWLGTNLRLAAPEEAAAALVADPQAVAIIDAPLTERFNNALASSGVAATAGTVVEGLNYSTGKRVALTIYRRTP